VVADAGALVRVPAPDPRHVLKSLVLDAVVPLTKRQYVEAHRPGAEGQVEERPQECDPYGQGQGHADRALP